MFIFVFASGTCEADRTGPVREADPITRLCLPSVKNLQKFFLVDLCSSEFAGFGQFGLADIFSDY
jgi:hypothetical protein